MSHSWYLSPSLTPESVRTVFASSRRNNDPHGNSCSCTGYCSTFEESLTLAAASGVCCFGPLLRGLSRFTAFAAEGESKRTAAHRYHNRRTPAGLPGMVRIETDYMTSFGPIPGRLTCLRSPRTCSDLTRVATILRQAPGLRVLTHRCLLARG
jgi:hypothetical protein